MPVFSFRLEAQDGSGHYRAGATEAESEEEARRFLEFREARWTHYRIPVEELAAIDERCDKLRLAHDLPNWPKNAGVDKKQELLKARGIHLTMNERAHLALDRQEKPYKLVKLEKVG